MVVIAIFFLAGLATLIVLLSRRKKHHKETFRKCICSSDQGGRERECQDNVTVNNLYVTNQLTENSDLRSKDWGTISPGDMDFPHSQGCKWCDSPSRGWTTGDFTDFGN